MVDIEKKEEYELDMREKDLKAPSSPKLKHRRKEAPLLEIMSAAYTQGPNLKEGITTSSIKSTLQKRK
jgi:hypothetical protein